MHMALIDKPAVPGKFDKDASRYHQGVYSRKRLDLIKAIDTALSPLFMGQLKNVHKRCVATFRTDLLNGLKGDGHDFGALVKQVGERVEKEFIEGAQGKSPYAVHLTHSTFAYFFALNVL